MTYSHGITDLPEEKGAKLVRDKIPEIIFANEGVRARTRVLNEVEFEKALVVKLREEIAELVNAVESKDAGNITEESADTLEIILTIARMYGVSFEKIVETQEHKREDRGGFEKGILLLGKEKP